MHSDLFGTQANAVTTPCRLQTFLLPLDNTDRRLIGCSLQRRGAVVRGQGLVGMGSRTSPNSSGRTCLPKATLLWITMKPLLAPLLRSSAVASLHSREYTSAEYSRPEQGAMTSFPPPLPIRLNDASGLRTASTSRLSTSRSREPGVRACARGLGA